MTLGDFVLPIAMIAFVGIAFASDDDLTDDERPEHAGHDVRLAAITMPTPAPCADTAAVSYFHDGENEEHTTFYLGTGKGRVIVTLCWHTDDVDVANWLVHVVSSVDAPEPPTP